MAHETATPPAFIPPRLTEEPLHERVYRDLKAAIMSARFKEGERLTVRGMAALFGVSPMPVRAAFSRLAAEKAVTATSGGTIIIPVMTRSRFEELIDLRIALEGRATEAAAAIMRPETLERLAVIGAMLSEAALRDDAAAYLDHNRAFKFTIYESLGTEVLIDLIERLWLQIGPFMRLYSTGIRFQHSIDRHDDVLSALRRRDGPGARGAIAEDIAQGAAYLRSVAGFGDAGRGGRRLRQGHRCCSRSVPSILRLRRCRTRG